MQKLKMKKPSEGHYCAR